MTRSELQQAIDAGKARLADEESATRARLAAHYRDAWLRLEAEIVLVERELAAMDADQLSDLWKRYTRDGRATRLQRLRQLRDQVALEYDRASAAVLRELAGADVSVASSARTDASAMVAAQAPELAAGFQPALNTQAYDRLVAATEPGSPLHRVLAGYGDEFAGVVETTLVDGAIRGHGVDRVVRTILEQIGDGGVPRHRVALITRTELLRSYRGSLFDSYQAMGIDQWQWVAALQTRTCLACLEMHGQVFDNDDDFMKAHPGCRCTPVPYILGIGGPTGEEYFQSLPEDVKRQKMGRAYDAYQRGDVPFSAFTGTRTSATWGDSVYQRSAQQVLGQGNGGRPVAQRSFVELGSQSEIENYVDDWAYDWADGLSDGERDALTWYQDNGYQPINAYLRPHTQPRPRIQRQIEREKDVIDASIPQMDAAISRSVVPSDVTVYRGVRQGVFGAEVRVDDMLTDTGYMSTSLNRERGDRFVNLAQGRGEDAYLMRIQVPKGTNGAYLDSLHPNDEWDISEQELLLPRGTSMVVTGVSEKDGLIVLDLEVLP